MLRALVCVLALVNFGCDGDSDPDAGGSDDAGSMMDAGVRDAGTTDGGRDAGFDSGPLPDADTAPLIPPSIVLATEVEDFHAAHDAAPMETLVNGNVMGLELGATAIDLLVGEDGLDTLSLSDATVRALADWWLAGRLVELVAGAVDGLATSIDPDVIAMASAGGSMRDALIVYRDQLRALYRSRLDLGITGTAMPMLTSDSHSTFSTGQIVSFLVVIEGSDSIMNQAMFYWNCDNTRVVNSIEVFHAENGTSLFRTANPASSIPISVQFEQTTALRVVIDGPAREVGNYPECALLFDGRRRLREAPIDLTGDIELGEARSEYRIALSFLASSDNEVRTAGAGTIDLTFMDSIERIVTIYDGVFSQFLASTAVIPREDLQRIVRLNALVDPIMSALIANPRIQGVEWMNVVRDLGTIQTQGRRMAAVAARP